MKYLYGNLSKTQLEILKKSLRGDIFFLLLCVDKKTSLELSNINVIDSFDSIIKRIEIWNHLLLGKIELLNTISLLESARLEYREGYINKNNFNYSLYRKYILDAGSEIMRIKSEV